jgi:hypothetical protein
MNFSSSNSPTNRLQKRVTGQKEKSYQNNFDLEEDVEETHHINRPNKIKRWFILQRFYYLNYYYLY